MRFALTEDQVALRDAVRELLAERCPAATVRAAWPGGDPAPVEALWRDLTAMGVLGAAVPDEHGGLGLRETDLVPLLEECGRAAVPLPVAETAAVVAPLLAAAGHPLLPAVLAGQTRVALAAGPFTPYGQRAEQALVLDGGAAWLVPLAGAPPVTTVDGARAAVRSPAPTGEPVTRDPGLLRAARWRADLCLAAQLVGLSRALLEMTVAYVRERRQFGVPVGSFQAVKHHLADALLRIEFAAPAVLAAGWALAQAAPTRAADVAAAAVLATEAAQTTARTAIQCHGGIGYTVEYDLHLYAKRVWALTAGSDVDGHLEKLAGVLGLKGAS
ncbi:acyl-CoA dehydrogenase family protein [Phytohabitans sp. LJ34]|uniref:acyl-CoA dehydrogenase family protein n=1 Tax=Phytohabitans sp. LJ34 TaxID=3452217 RepID=UPI003F8C6528